VVFFPGRKSLLSRRTIYVYSVSALIIIYMYIYTYLCADLYIVIKIWHLCFVPVYRSVLNITNQSAVVAWTSLGPNICYVFTTGYGFPVSGWISVVFVIWEASKGLFSPIGRARTDQFFRTSLRVDSEWRYPHDHILTI